MQMPSAAIGELDEHDAVYPGHRWHAVMHTIVAAARANGLRAWTGLTRASRTRPVSSAPAGSRARWGSTASSASIRRSWRRPTRLQSGGGRRWRTPTVSCGVRTTAAAKDAARVTLDGKMIDAANIRMARVVLEKNELARRQGMSGRCYEDFEVGE